MLRSLQMQCAVNVHNWAAACSGPVSAEDPHRPAALLSRKQLWLASDDAFVCWHLAMLNASECQKFDQSMPMRH